MDTIKDFFLEKKMAFICGILALACLGMGVLYLKKASAEEAFHCPVETLDENEELEMLDDSLIHVDIKGAIRNPGVYEMMTGSVVNDLIREAGGLMSNADTSTLNLSKKLTNEMVIIVYTKDEVREMKKNDSLGDASILDGIKENAAIIGEEAENNSPNTNEKINLNTATKEQLDSIPGIGEAKAQSIIEYRKTCGAFKKIEDIKNISGIGDAVFEKLKDYITV